MRAPSVDANNFHSRCVLIQPRVKFTPFTLRSRSLTASRSSALSATGILNGSFSSAVCHTSTCAGFGASSTFCALTAALAFASAVAMSASFFISPTSTLGVDAKPQAPLTSTRRPTPKRSESSTPST